jgi:hypothetical protein
MIKAVKLLHKKDDKGASRVLLLGASVGKAWNFPGWPQRMNRTGLVFEMIPVYSFDKSEGLTDIFIRPKRKIRFNKRFVKSLLKPVPRKPDVIILKECAAYFPGDLKRYKGLVQEWISQIHNEGIKPALATVVPVTKEHAQRKHDRQDSIWVYNDWIRKISRDRGIFCLDMEEALRIGESDRSLNPDFAAEDGLHLKSKAYDILDKFLLDRVEKLEK